MVLLFPQLTAAPGRHHVLQHWVDILILGDIFRQGTRLSVEAEQRHILHAHGIVDALEMVVFVLQDLCVPALGILGEGLPS